MISVISGRENGCPFSQYYEMLARHFLARHLELLHGEIETKKHLPASWVDLPKAALPSIANPIINAAHATKPPHKGRQQKFFSGDARRSRFRKLTKVPSRGHFVQSPSFSPDDSNIGPSASPGANLTPAKPQTDPTMDVLRTQ